MTCLAVVALLAGAARAQTADDTLSRARAHFEAGRALYQLGNYTEAVREFSAGYQLVPRPQFLLNLGQCYRKLDDLPKARDMYRRYLHEAAANDPERPQAQQILDEIERRLAAPKPAPPPPAAPAPAPTVAPSPAAPAPAPAPAASSAHSPAAMVVASAPPPEKKPFIKRNWWIIPVGAVVVGVGVGLGVYYGTRPADPCSGANLGCWNLAN